MHDYSKNNNNSGCNADLRTHQLDRISKQSQLSPDSIIISQEYKQIAPDMLPNEFHALKESIKQHGLYYAIIVNREGILLDGHHRYEICRTIGIEPRIEIRSFNDQLHEKLFICESAGRRRNLNEWQKIQIATSTEKVLKEIARQNSLANLKQNRIQNKSNYRVVQMN